MLVKNILLVIVFSSQTIGCGLLEDLSRSFGRSRIEEFSGNMESWRQEVSDLEKQIDGCLVASDRLGLFYRRIAEEHAKRGNQIQATNYYKKAIDHGENSASVFHELAASLAHQARFEAEAGNRQKAQQIGQQALIHYNKALLQEPQRSITVYGRALLYYYVLNQSQKAIEELEELQRQEPQNTRIKFALARIYFQEGKYQQAISAYQALQDFFEEGSEESRNLESNINQVLIRMKSQGK